MFNIFKKKEADPVIDSLREKWSISAHDAILKYGSARGVLDELITDGYVVGNSQIGILMVESLKELQAELKRINDRIDVIKSI